VPNACQALDEVFPGTPHQRCWVHKTANGNKGSAGVDRMTVDQLGDYLKQYWPAIREQLLNGTYEPNR
jgi:retron-type reverse transcriptase